MELLIDGTVVKIMQFYETLINGIVARIMQ